MRIGRFFDIDVKLHPSFVLFFVVSPLWFSGVSWGAVIGGYLALIVLFGVVVLHEFGHALTARRFGVRTKEIVLLPFGGVAKLSHFPTEPLAECIIAIAGPAVNFVLAGLVYLLGQSPYASLWDFASAWETEGDLLSSFFFLNVMIGTFNLVPAFPLDGGRVLRSLLCLKLDRLSATRLSVAIGSVFGVCLATYGLLWNFNIMYVLVGLFIVFAGNTELAWILKLAALKGMKAGHLCLPFDEIYCLDQADRIGDVVEVIARLPQSVYPVFGWPAPPLAVTRDQLLRSLLRGPDTLVRFCALAKYSVVGPETPLRHLLNDPERPDIFFVVEGDAFIGVIIPEQILLCAAIRMQSNRRS